MLKPGGKLFFVDSAQVGDGKALGMEKAFDQALERFPMFNHEPYYRDYANSDLAETFGEFGLELEESTVAWVSKCMMFTKKKNESRADGGEEDDAQGTPSDEGVDAGDADGGVEALSEEPQPVAA